MPMVYACCMELEILQQLGLNTEEAQIYASLLENGAQSASKLATTTGIKRTYIYYVSQALVAKGLINQEKRERTTMFSPRSPDMLLSLASSQKEKTIAAERALEGILAGLKTKYLAREEKPIVTTYEGVEGLKKIYEDTIKEGKEIYAVLQSYEVDPELKEWLKSYYIKKRADLNIHAKVILSAESISPEYHTRDKIALRTVIDVPSSLYPFAHEVDVYGDKVAFIHYKKDEPLVGIIIHHPQIARTMKAWFDLAWAGAQKSPSEDQP